MRDIKFRAWDKARKSWVQDFEVSSEGQPFWLDAEGGTNSLGRVELMQYTGLKDKNGVEIYEGDILQRDDKKAFEIVYDSEHAAFEPLFRLTGWTPDLSIIAEYGEVIGSIYENPGLLE